MVDDDPRVGKALARLLAALGHRAELFASADAFLNAVATMDATCVMVDIDLGSSSGLDLARQLSRSGFEFPIIFMTGAHDEAIRAECLKFGCVAFLRKPFSEEQLAEAIGKVTGGSVHAR